MGHNNIGHNFICPNYGDYEILYRPALCRNKYTGRRYIGHDCVGGNCEGQTCLGHNYVGHTFTDHNDTGRTCSLCMAPHIINYNDIIITNIIDQ